MSPRIASRLLHYRWPIVVVVVTTLLISLLYITREKPKVRPALAAQWQVEERPAVFEGGSAQIRLYGRVESPHRVTLSAPVTGYVQSLMVLEGSAVKAGDILLRIDPRDQQLVIARQQADVQDAQARLASERLSVDSNRQALVKEKTLLAVAQQEYERQLSMNRQKLVSESVVESSQITLARQQLAVIQRQQFIDDHSNRLQQLSAQLTRAEAGLEQAQLALERSELRAPFAGRVTSLPVASGERVKAGDALVELYPQAQLEIRAQLTDRYLPQIGKRLAAGQPIRATLQYEGLNGGHQSEWLLHRLAAEVDSGRAGVDGLFRIAGHSPAHIVPGRSVVLTAYVPLSSDVVRVEPGMLYDDSFVYRITSGNTLEAVPVTRQGTIEENGREFILISGAGLREGDRLMTTRVANAITGLKVSPMATAPAINAPAISTPAINASLVNSEQGGRP